MKFFINLSTRTKLIVGFGIIWLMLATIVVLAYRGNAENTESERVLHDVHFQSALALSELRAQSEFQPGADVGNDVKHQEIGL